jgi:hypothetical protein
MGLPAVLRFGGMPGMGGDTALPEEPPREGENSLAAVPYIAIVRVQSTPFFSESILCTSAAPSRSCSSGG